MKKKKLLILYFFAILLTSCSPSFYLKKNHKIGEIKMKVEYGAKITPEQVSSIKTNLTQFFSEFNEEKHSFKVSLTESNEADITLRFDKIRAPAKFFQIAATTISIGISYSLLFVKPTVGIYLVPFSWLNQLYNTTVCHYAVNRSISDFPKREQVVGFGTPRRFNSRETELHQHLRSLDFQLGVFFDDFEKEYIKKNSL